MNPNWQTICESLRDHPDDWEAGQSTLTHKSGVSLWVSNGWIFVDSTDYSKVRVLLSLYGKWKIWQEYKRWKMRQLPLFMSAVEGKSDGSDV